MQNRRRLAVTLIAMVSLPLAIACDATNSPSSPTVVPDFGGTWTGSYQVDFCATSIPGPYCSTSFKGNPGPYSVTLTLEQRGAGVSGTVTLHPCSITFTSPCPISDVYTVTGGVDNRNQLTLTGTTPFQQRITDWRTSLSDDSLSGDFSTEEDSNGLIWSEHANVLGLQRRAP